MADNFLGFAQMMARRFPTAYRLLGACYAALVVFLIALRWVLLTAGISDDVATSIAIVASFGVALAVQWWRWNCAVGGESLVGWAEPLHAGDTLPRPTPNTLRLLVGLSWDPPHLEQRARLWSVLVINTAMTAVLLGSLALALVLIGRGQEVPPLVTTLITTSFGYFGGIVASFIRLRA